MEMDVVCDADPSWNRSFRALTGRRRHSATKDGLAIREWDSQASNYLSQTSFALAARDAAA